MKKDNDNLLLLLLIGGGVAYYGYQQGWFSKGKDTTDETPSGDAPDEALAQTNVEALQAILGVGVDGIFGKNSYMALCKMYNCVTGTSYDVSKLPYGAVTESNASKYISDIQNGSTPNQKANGSSAPSASTNQNVNSPAYMASNMSKVYLNSAKYGSFEIFLDWILQDDGSLKKQSWYGTYKNISSSKPVVNQFLTYKGWSNAISAFMFVDSNNPKKYTIIEPKYLVVK